MVAFVNSLAKVVLTCLPELGGKRWKRPSPGREAGTRALLKSAVQAMVGDSQLAMQDLLNRAEA